MVINNHPSNISIRPGVSLPKSDAHWYMDARNQLFDLAGCLEPKPWFGGHYLCSCLSILTPQFDVQFLYRSQMHARGRRSSSVSARSLPPIAPPSVSPYTPRLFVHKSSTCTFYQNYENFLAYVTQTQTTDKECQLRPASHRHLLLQQQAGATPLYLRLSLNNMSRTVYK